MLKTKDFKYYSAEEKLANPTSSDREIRDVSLKILKNIFRPNMTYRATGITLKELTYGKQIQQSLFDNLSPHDDKLSHLIDELEDKYGTGVIKTVM